MKIQTSREKSAISPAPLPPRNEVARSPVRKNLHLEMRRGDGVVRCICYSLPRAKPIRHITSAVVHPTTVRSAFNFAVIFYFIINIICFRDCRSGRDFVLFGGKTGRRQVPFGWYSSFVSVIVVVCFQLFGGVT